MPTPVRACLFTAALLAAIVAGATAHAEMTEADRAGTLTFTACLDEADSGEAKCIEKLGRLAWYPRDDDTCEAIGTRVGRIIGLGGDPVWRDLFQNERCARLDMPHGAVGLPSPGDSPAGQRYLACQERSNWLSCLELVGRHEINYAALDGCRSMAKRLKKAGERIYFQWWDQLFENERCWRLGDAHFDTTTAPPR